MTSKQYWLGIAKLKNVFTLTINPSNKLQKFLIKQTFLEWPTNAFRQAYLDSGFSYRLDFFTNQCCFVKRRAFSPTAEVPMLASWFYQSLPLFSFVLYSFLHYRIGSNLWYAHHGFSVRGYFAWNITQCVRSSWKRCIVIHHDGTAYLLLNWWLGAPSTIRVQSGWLGCNCSPSFYDC